MKGYTFTTWKSKDPCYEEWTGVARRNGEVVATGPWKSTRKEAIQAVKEKVTITEAKEK